MTVASPEVVVENGLLRARVLELETELARSVRPISVCNHETELAKYRSGVPALEARHAKLLAIANALLACGDAAVARDRVEDACLYLMPVGIDYDLLDKKNRGIAKSLAAPVLVLGTVVTLQRAAKQAITGVSS